MQVLASKETPGLGDKIEKDAAFLANFEALDVAGAADGQTLQHPIEAVKQRCENSALADRRHHRGHHFLQGDCRILRQSSAAGCPCSARQPTGKLEEADAE